MRDYRGKLIDFRVEQRFTVAHKFPDGAAEDEPDAKADNQYQQDYQGNFRFTHYPARLINHFNNAGNDHNQSGLRGAKPIVLLLRNR